MSFLTVNEQKLLESVLESRFVTYRTQKIFSSRRFFDAMRLFRENRYVNPVCSVCKRKIREGNGTTCRSRRCTEKSGITAKTYELTLPGEILANELSSIKR